jgi:type I restriction enzyme S subunit
MKIYPAYKPMDELWLQSIPSHWNAIKIKRCFAERIEKGYPNEPLLVASQNMGVVPKDIYGNRTVEAQKDLHLLKLVEVGDFVISLRSFQGGIEYAYYRGIISPAYTVMKPNENINKGYFRHLAKSRLFLELLQMSVTGIREGQNIDYQKLKNHAIPTPPLTEQTQIAYYLDWQLSLLLRLISAKKKQIALLKEQRQVLINEAVTRGEESWTETRLINLVSSIKAGAWGDEENGTGTNCICIRVADFDFEHLRVKNKDYTIRNYQQSTIDKLLLRKNDILIEKSGGGANQPVGRAVLFDKDFPALYANFIESIRTNTETDAQFLVYLLASMYYCRRNNIHFNHTTGIQNLDVKEYLRESMPIPPLTEQQSIVAYLDERCGAIDNLTSKLQDELTLIDEYRTRLISDVVTGRIDIREIAVPEYESSSDSTELLEIEEKMEGISDD